MTAPPDHSCLYQTAKERPEPIRAEIRGKIPSWLNGTLIRNGPGRFECGDTSFNHWFDGQALLHRFHIQEGNVTYSNKFVRSESYADSLKRGNSCHLEFGSFIPPDPCQNIFSRFFSRYWGQELSFDNTCVNVFPMKDKMYATTESEILFQIDPKTLDTLNKVDLSKEFPGDITISSATAHPQVTPDGSVINISVTFGMNSTYNIICIPCSTGEAGETTLAGGKVICSIPPTSGIAYFHSFCFTENYIVVTEIPLLLNVWRILSHRLFGTTYEDWLYWDPNQRARFHVVDRKNGKRVGVFTADPFFVFHHINAFEKDGKIHLDACCYRDHSLVKQLYLHNMRSPAEPGKKKFATPYVRRYELPIKDLGDAEEKPLPKGGDGRDFILLFIGMELPRINYEEHNGKPYSVNFNAACRWSKVVMALHLNNIVQATRDGVVKFPDMILLDLQPDTLWIACKRFVYGVRSRDAQSIFGKLVKVNVETKEFVTWEEPGGFASEPVFVKAPDGKAEDDGVILSCVINVEDQSTSLLVLDAKEFKELGRGVVEGVTPVALHGIFQ